MWEEVRNALNQSTTRVITEIANLLPGMVALFVAMVISALIAWMVSMVLKRSLKGIGFDQRLAGWGLSGVADWSPGRSPTLLLARTVAWIIILIGFLIGIAAFDATLTSRLVLQMFGYLPNVMAAILLLIFGNIVARFLARGVLISAVNLNLQYARLLSLGVKWLVVVLTATMALNHLGIGGQILDLAFGILFGGIVLALALAVGLGSKELVSRSLERQTSKPPEEMAEPFRHL
jgi:Mechanosensitive ion channel, conserved TM helix